MSDLQAMLTAYRVAVLISRHHAIWFSAAIRSCSS